MNRDIKFEYGFQSINGIVKKVYHLHEIPNIKEICDVWNVLPIVYVRRFTGLKDKKGTDIYENDIVRILYTDWESKSESDNRTLDQYLKDIASIGVVKFNNSSWEVFFKSTKHEYFDGYSSIYHGKHGYIEKIGTIHENPELIP